MVSPRETLGAVFPLAPAARVFLLPGDRDRPGVPLYLDRSAKSSAPLTDPSPAKTMPSASDAYSGTSGGAAAAKPDLGDVFSQLDLSDENFDDVEIDAEDPEINESVRWLC